jgi:hypothetical protein
MACEGANEQMVYFQSSTEAQKDPHPVWARNHGFLGEDANSKIRRTNCMVENSTKDIEGNLELAKRGWLTSWSESVV